MEKTFVKFYRFPQEKIDHHYIIVLLDMDSLDNDYNYCPQRSWGKVIFSEVCVKNSVHREGSPGPHPRGKLRGLTGGGLQAHTRGGLSRPRPGGVSQHALRQTPPSRRLLLQAVRILLECILVYAEFMEVNSNRYDKFCSHKNGY